LLRAKMSAGELDQVLECAIALEVLLGDRAVSDKVGLTRLMANRCAYALGRTSKERDDLREFFEKFYAIRSEIVHNGRFEQSEENEELVWESVDLVSRVLVHEQNMGVRALEG